MAYWCARAVKKLLKIIAVVDEDLKHVLNTLFLKRQLFPLDRDCLWVYWQVVCESAPNKSEEFTKKYMNILYLTNFSGVVEN